MGLWNFSEHKTIWAGNFKILLLLQFLSPPNFEDCLPCGNTDYYFSWQSGKFEKFRGTVKNFNGNQGGNPKICNILKTADRRAELMKIWAQSVGNCICWVLFISDSLSTQLRVQNFLYKRFSQGGRPPPRGLPAENTERGWGWDGGWWCLGVC